MLVNTRSRKITHRKGDTILDALTEQRRNYDGKKWRRLCSWDQCEKNAQTKGYCARHLRQLNQHETASASNSIDDVSSVASSSDLCQDGNTLIEWDQQPTQSNELPRCEYSIVPDNSMSCSNDPADSCTHFSQTLSLHHGLQHQHELMAEISSRLFETSADNISPVASELDIDDILNNLHSPAPFNDDCSLMDTTSSDQRDDLLDWLEEQQKQCVSQPVVETESCELNACIICFANLSRQCCLLNE